MLACGLGTSLDLINNYLSVGITWGKVVSLYSVAAGLAVDCVRQAQPAMVHALVDCLGEFVRKTLATWLRRRGGWVSLRIRGAVWWRCWETEGRGGMEDGAVGKGFRTQGCSKTKAGAGSSVSALTCSLIPNSCLLAAPRRCLAEKGQ